MAYDFVSGSSQYLVTAAIPVTNTPCTLAGWFYKDLAGLGTIVSLANNASTGQRIVLFSGNANAVAAQVANASTNAASSTGGTTTLEVWQHAAGVFASSTSRTAYFNGTAGTTNTSTVTNPTGLNCVSIGATATSPIQLIFDGRLADIGVWNVALTAAEIASLAKGMTCDRIRPQNLVFYAPLIRNLQDVRAGLTITNTNTATVTDHPRVY